MAFGSLSVKGRALRYLSQREHGRAELARKLTRHLPQVEPAEAAAQISAALDELVALGLLSEERAAASVLNTQGRRFGSRRLQQSLQSKGFAPELVASTLASAHSSEHARALAVWQRKFGGLPQSAAEHGKQMRFMLRRGFSAELARRVLREGGATDNGEDNGEDNSEDGGEDGGHGIPAFGQPEEPGL